MKLIDHISRWNIWRKRNLNSRFYKFLVLIGVAKSPTMAFTLSNREERELNDTLRKIFEEADYMAKVDPEEMYQRRKRGEITTLRYLMYEKKITTKTLAEETGLSKRTLDEYVSGTRPIEKIGFKSGLEIARVLDVNPYDLI